MRPLPVLCSALVLGWLSTAAAQEVVPSPTEPPEEGGLPQDLPDNMDAMRSTPLADAADAAQAFDAVKEVEGRVVSVVGEEVWVEYAGQLQPLTVTEATQLEPGREQVLREGAEVRAQFSPGAKGRPEALRIEARE